MYKKTKNSIISRIVLIIGILICIFMLIYKLKSEGGFSKLRYTGINNYSSAPVVTEGMNLEEIYGSEIIEENENLKWRIEKYLVEIQEFIYDEYGLELFIPEYNVVILNGVNEIFTCVNNHGEIYICISKEYLETMPKEKIEPLIIHEIFHLFSAQDGHLTSINNNTLAVSNLAEGFTDIMTDRFIKSRGYDYLPISSITAYKYSMTICQMILSVDNSAEKMFASYYFLDDQAFTKFFNSKVCESTNASEKFNAYERLEMCLANVVENIDLTNSINASLELTIYFGANFGKETKEDYLYKYIPRIESFTKYNLKEVDFEYFKSIINNAG